MFSSFVTTSFITFCWISNDGDGLDETASSHSGLTELDVDAGVKGAASVNNPF